MRDKYHKIARLGLAPVLTTILMVGIFFLNGMYPFGNGTMTLSDAVYQTVPFLNDFKDILDGKTSIFLNFRNSGGMNFYGIFFFFLSSPFSFLVKFVDKIRMVEFLNVLVVLKMATGALSCAYCLDYCRKKLATPLLVFLSVVYAFSGYNMMYYDVNISWLDMVYLFPVLVASLTRIVRNEGSTLYIIILSFSCIINYYLTYMSAIFILLFLLAYLIVNYRNEGSKRVCREILFGSFLAILISSFVWLPCLNQYLESARLQGNLFENIAKHKLFFHDYQTTLPMLMATAAPFVFVFMGKRKESRFYVMVSLFMLLPFVLEPINLLWHGGNYIGLPCRFGYMSIFTLIFSASYFLEEIKVNKQVKSLWLKVPILLFCILGVSFSCWYTQNLLSNELFSLSSFVRNVSGDGTSFVYIAEIFVIISVTYALIFWSYKRGFFSKDLLVMLCGAVLLVEILTNTSIYMVSSSQFFSEPNHIEVKLYNLSDRAKEDNFFRVTAKDLFNKDNFNILGAIGYNSLSHYSSLINGNYLETMRRLGYSGTLVAILHAGGTRLTDALMSVSYTVNGDELEAKDESLPMGLILPKGSLKEAEFIPSNLDRAGVQEYLSKYVLGEGIIKRYFPVESIDRFEKDYFIENNTVFNYILDIKGEESVYLDLFNGLIKDVKDPLWEAMEVWGNGQKKCDSYPVYDDNGLLYVGDFHNEQVRITLRFKKYVRCNSFAIFSLDRDKLRDFCKRAEGANLNVRGNGLYGKCSSKDDSTLFVSLPYSDNFTVKVNGHKVPYRRALSGFISFDLGRGENEISVTFLPRGFVGGAILSAIGLVLLGLYVRFGYKLGECERLNKISKLVMFSISMGVFVIVYIVPVAVKVFVG